ncbi:FkbM family methyltransferase [Synechococcus sp. HK01-R]|uniref:FkbM family methyltransferase n=1 Tax=Synechococcus sp. HK01-R TaxID=2751171 RepID=UPI00162854D0|nr:FkbM family methyltransferase [Synechococcus sp. HK01-R]QNG26980.1 FkbM family methyltransferase [Synechococcus sp. HK01-R]
MEKFLEIMHLIKELNFQVKQISEAVSSLSAQQLSIISQMAEIASFANASKNGRCYTLSDGTILTTIFTGQIIAVDWLDVSLAPHITLNGEWEMENTARCEEVVRKLGDNPVIFDVGANYGWYGLILSRLHSNSNIYFFEANSSLIPNLQKTTLLNGISLRSKIVNRAVSVASGDTLTLSIPGLHRGSASTQGFNTDLEIFHEKSADVVQQKIDSISLDDYCRSESIESIDFLKIDVEGAEANVLLGAKGVIEKSSNLSIFMEWNRGRYPEEVFAIIKSFETCYSFDSSGRLVDLSDLLHNSLALAHFERNCANALCVDNNNSFFDIYLHKKMVFV